MAELTNAEIDDALSRQILHGAARRPREIAGKGGRLPCQCGEGRAPAQDSPS
jgi:hypothetical protein